MWLTAITFLSIGYGDIVPNTWVNFVNISTISNSILDEHQIDSIQVNSQVNLIQLNQYTEPPPSYEMIAIELPSYDEAVKHENSNGISSNGISFNEISSNGISSNGIPIQKAWILIVKKIYCKLFILNYLKSAK